MDRIRELNRYQKVILLILLAMLVVFGIVYIWAASQKGYAYKEEIFLPSYENGDTVYSGRLYDADCSFTVTADKVVSFRCEDKYYGPYTAVEDPSAIPAQYSQSPGVTGVELRENGKLLFRGAFLSHQPAGFRLVDENGDLYGFGVVVTMSDGSMYDGNGIRHDPWEPGVYTILELMGQPQLTKKCEWGFFFLGLFLSLVAACNILFADELFRLSLVFSVRDWDRAEPSDFEIAGRYISWTLFPILVLWAYCSGLNL